MPQWTNEQAKAIHEREANILVSAAAGSGKTAVLVERILKLITEERVEITEMLIVTFTKAAAGEMRERILLALMNEMVKNKGDADFLRKQIGLINRAPIKTLHAFCMDVIRQNFHQLDIDPAFRIGDFSELLVMKQQVMDGLIEEEYEKAHPNFIGLVECYSGNRSDERLQAMILKLHGFIKSKPDPEIWLEEMIGLYNLDIKNLHQHIWMKTLLEDAKDGLQASRELLEEALYICAMDEGPDLYITALESDLRLVEHLVEAMDHDIQSFIHAVSNISYERLKAIPKKMKEQFSEKLIEQVKQLRDHVKKDMIEPIKKAFSGLSSEALKDQTNEMKPMMAYIGKLALDFDHRFTLVKRDKDMLDFNDLEHLAIQLFKIPEISKYYRELFKYIFIDEYQDSNIVQETIINYIKKDNNLFMVGDVKQSIYKFRLADPTLFIDKYESYPSEKENGKLRIDLNKNFRSRPDILEGINFIFENLMSKEFGEIRYDDGAALYQGMNFEPLDQSSLNLRIIDLNPRDVELDDELADISSAEIEAKAIAMEVKDLLKQQTYDPRKGIFRRMTYRDMVVLLRATRSWSPVFQEVFASEGIPLYAESNVGYFDAMEIKILLDFLRVIDNKKQDIPIISVLRSPFFGFKTEELVEIRIKYPKLSYYEALNEYSQECDNELAHKINKSMEMILDYSSKAKYQKLNDFIWAVLIETKYFHYVGALPGGDVRQANLKMLVNYADDFERTSLTGLFSFIKYLELITQSSGDMGEARTLSENDNVLRLMSIHKSKGLEFPIVFVAGLGKQFNQQDLRSDLILHKDLGITARYVDADKRIYSDSFGIAASKKRIKLENLAEEMRILYVALTRAVDRLYLYGTVKNLDKNMDKWLRGNSKFFLKKAMNYLGWLMPILFTHKDFQEFIQSQDKESHIETLQTKSSWNFETQHVQEIMDQAIEHVIHEEMLKFKLLNQVNQFADEGLAFVEKRFNWQYSHEQMRKLPLKMAVTDLIKRREQKESKDIPDLVTVPRFMKEEEVMVGSEFGTITHAFMEHVTLNQEMNSDYLQKEVQRMVEEHILTQEDSRIVQLNKIEYFFKSEIGRRMLNAEKVFREQHFVIALNASEYIGESNEEVVVQGVIDCYFEEPDGLVIIDYKTDSTKDKTKEEIVAKYQSQLVLYAKALERGTQRPVKEAILYLFSCDESLRVV